jgi:hypothetical protein
MNPANRAAAITSAARRPSFQPTLARQKLAQTVAAAATAASGTGASNSNALFPAAAAAATAASSAPGSNALFPNATAASPVTAPTVTPPAPAQPPTAQSAFGASPWVTNPTGTGPTGTYTYNPNYFATPQTAAQVAAMVGGTVVALNALGGPAGNPFVQDQPNEMVRLANGAMINPGLVASFYTHGYPQSMVDQMVANEVANVSKGT